MLLFNTCFYLCTFLYSYVQYTPVEFDIVTIQWPEHTMVEYLNTVCSFLSIWFGISMFGAGFSFLNLLSRQRHFIIKPKKIIKLQSKRIV